MGGWSIVASWLARLPWLFGCNKDFTLPKVGSVSFRAIGTSFHSVNASFALSIAGVALVLGGEVLFTADFARNCLSAFSLRVAKALAFAALSGGWGVE